MQGIAAYNCAGRHLFACLPVLLHDPVAFFPFEDLDADGFIIEDAHAVRTEVYVTRVRVLQHQEYCGTKVSASIQFVEPGGWKGEGIDLIPLEDILEDGAVFLFFCPDDLLNSDIDPFLRELDHGEVRALSKDDCEPLGRAECTGQDRALIPLDILKEQRRTAFLFNKLRNVRNLKVPVHLSLDPF